MDKWDNSGLQTSPQSKEPENLSAESVHDLDYWLTGILKKAKRRAGIKEDNEAAKKPKHKLI